MSMARQAGPALTQLLPEGKGQTIVRPYPSKAYQKVTIKKIIARVLAIAAGTVSTIIIWRIQEESERICVFNCVLNTFTDLVLYSLQDFRI